MGGIRFEVPSRYGLYRYSTKAGMDRMFDAQKAKLNRPLSKTELMIVLSEATTAIGCGCGNISCSAADTGRRPGCDVAGDFQFAPPRGTPLAPCHREFRGSLGTRAIPGAFRSADSRRSAGKCAAGTRRSLYGGLENCGLHARGYYRNSSAGDDIQWWYRHRLVALREKELPWFPHLTEFRSVCSGLRVVREFSGKRCQRLMRTFICLPGR